jgi:predicted ABC-type ATPase
MAHNLAFEELERQVSKALEGGKDFAYETNFNSTPLFWPEKFKANGYELHLIYFVLDSIEEAKRRVAIRVENGGHFVPEAEIQKRYFDGFSNLNTHYHYFDSVDVCDSSAYKKEPSFCFSLVQGQLAINNYFPEFLKSLIPSIAEKFS